MSREQGGPIPHHSNLGDLLDSANFFKREGQDVSDGLRELERQILAGLSGDSAGFAGPIPETLLSELGAEIFDTLLSGYLKWYRSTLIAVSQWAEGDCLVFAGYAEIERPHHLGLGVAYEMENVVAGNEGPASPLRRIGPIPGSVRVVIDASRPVRVAVAALQIEKTVHHRLADPAAIVRSTLQCRLEAAYGYRGPIGDVGLSIDDGVVGVTIWRAKVPKAGA